MTLYIVLIIIGSVMIIEAIPLLISPSKIKEFYKMILEIDNRTLRLVAFIMILTGLLIVFLMRTKICQ